MSTQQPQSPPQGPTEKPSTRPVQPIRARLGLWDTINVIVGIVVGAAIFKAPTVVFGGVSGPWQALGLWALGGALATVGALCYAELASTYPRSGGDYVYLTRAYGPLVGFLFGWAHLVGILTGSVGALAYVFADYATALWQLNPSAAGWVAVSVVVGLTLMNLLGVLLGKTLQNLLTVAKVLGLTAIALAGLFGGQGVWGSAGELAPESGSGFGLALILVLYAYGGWNDAAFVAAEIKEGHRNIPRALIVGTGIVTLIYLLVNAGYVSAMGFARARSSPTPAADTLALVMGSWGFRGMCLLVMVSVLGALNGLILTGSRVHATMGADHRIFAWLAQWNARRGTPLRALLTQAAISLVLILGVGTVSGRGLLDGLLQQLGLSRIAWHRYGGGFGTLVSGTAPVFWLFFLLTGISLFVLRHRDRQLQRPFAVPLYPLVPIVFCLTCAYMLYASVAYAGSLALIMSLPFAMGLPLFWISRRMRPR